MISSTYVSSVGFEIGNAELRKRFQREEGSCFQVSQKRRLYITSQANNILTLLNMGLKWVDADDGEQHGFPF